MKYECSKYHDINELTQQDYRQQNQD